MIFDAWVRAAIIDFEEWQLVGSWKRNFSSSIGIDIHRSSGSGLGLRDLYLPDPLLIDAKAPLGEYRFGLLEPAA